MSHTIKMSTYTLSQKLARITRDVDDKGQKGGMAPRIDLLSSKHHTVVSE